MNLYFPKNTWKSALKTILFGVVYIAIVPSMLSQQNKIDSLSKEIQKTQLKQYFTEQGVPRQT
jgi:hypothetical protein